MDKISPTINSVKNKISDLVEKYHLNEGSNQAKIAFAFISGITALFILKRAISSTNIKAHDHDDRKQHGKSNRRNKKGVDIEQVDFKQAGVLTFAENEFRKNAVFDVEYGLVLFLDNVSATTYDGIANIRFRINKSKLQTQKLLLDYYGKEIFKLRINGTEIKTVQKFWRDSKIELTLDFLKDGLNEVEIYFTNEYADTTFEGGLFTTRESQENFVYTVNKPFSAHKVFPCFDQSNIRATFKVLLVTPDQWKVVANDNATNIDDIGSAFSSDTTLDLKERLGKLVTNWRLWAFDITDQISPSAFGFVAGDLETITLKDRNGSSLKLSLYARKSVAKQLKQESEDLFLLMGAAIENLEALFGKNYPSRKSDLIFLPHLLDQNLDIANCCIVDENLLLSYESDIMTNISRAVSIIQQQSLVWFQHYLAINWWNDAWIEQGLSLFLGYLGLTRIYRGLNSKFKKPKGFTEKNIWSHFTFAKEFKLLKRGSELSNPVCRSFEDSTQYESMDAQVYQWKAASAWKQLAFLIGDESFKRGIKKCFTELSGTIVTTEQFAKVFEQSFVVQNETPMGPPTDSFIISNTFEVNTFDFSRWMQDWIYAGGVSNLEVVWDKENILYNNMLRVKQSAVSENYKNMRNLRLKIAFFDHAGQIFKIKDTTVTSQEYTNFILEDRQRIPYGILLDCDGNSHFNCQIDSTSFEFFSHKLYTITDELSVSLILERCAQMVSHGKLSPSEYIHMVSRFLQEKSESVSGLLLQQILTLAQYIIEHYAPLNEQRSLKRAMCTPCFKLLRDDSSSIEYQIVLNETWRFLSKDDAVRSFTPILFRYIDSVENHTAKLAPKNVLRSLENCYLTDQNKNHYQTFVRYAQAIDLEQPIMSDLINDFILTCEHDVEKELRYLEDTVSFASSPYSYNELRLTLSSPLASDYITKLAQIIGRKAEKYDSKSLVQFLNYIWDINGDVAFQQTLLNHLSALNVHNNRRALAHWTKLRIHETQLKKSAPWF